VQGVQARPIDPGPVRQAGVVSQQQARRDGAAAFRPELGNIARDRRVRVYGPRRLRLQVGEPSDPLAIEAMAKGVRGVTGRRLSRSANPNASDQTTRPSRQIAAWAPTFFCLSWTASTAARNCACVASHAAAAAAGARQRADQYPGGGGNRAGFEQCAKSFSTKTLRAIHDGARTNSFA
jgi:hypothetical protein